VGGVNLRAEGGGDSAPCVARYGPQGASYILASNQIGKHGAKVKYLLDIWLRFGQARRDTRFKALKRKLKKRLWGWGF
jgi:hypothetical protein